MGLIQDKISDSVDSLEAHNYKPRIIKMSSKTRKMLVDELMPYLSFATKEKVRDQYRGLTIEISEGIPDGDILVTD